MEEFLTKLNTRQKVQVMLEPKHPSLYTWLLTSGYFDAPASAHHHGAYKGALADHSLAVAECLLTLTTQNGLVWQREESPVLVGLLHDVCKIDQYAYSPSDQRFSYRQDCLFSGHGAKSILMLASHVLLTEEEVACIRYHMGAFTPKEDWDYYTRAVHTYPNVLWTHQADMIASQIQGV